jgi:hypothetical protein
VLAPEKRGRRDITTRLTQAKELGEAIVVNGKSAFPPSPFLGSEHLFNVSSSVFGLGKKGARSRETGTEGTHSCR